MTDDVEQAVFEILSRRAEVDRTRVSRNASLSELGIDSLAGLEVVFALEDRFNINIPDEAAQRMKTVGDIVDGLRQLALPRSAEAE
jgi:acyl carrier protein